MIKNAVIVGDNITPERYNAEDAPRGTPDFVVRSHVLGEVLRNAQRWVKGYVSPESKAKKYGSLFDCLLLTPFQWPKRYAVLPPNPPRRPSEKQRNAKKQSDSTLAAIAFWDEWEAEHAGCETVTQEENASVHAAISRLREDKMISELIDCSAHQLMITAEWHDSTGLVVPMKCLIDVVPPPSHPVFANSLWDTKTTQNASPRQFSKDAMRYGYGIQGVFYLDLFNAATGENRPDFGHIVQESYHPYEYRTPPPLLTQRFLDHSRLLYHRALSIYCRALSTGVWPSYDHGAKDWPKTDCDDWFLSMDSLYDEIDEEPETEVEVEAPKEEEDVIP